MHPHRSIASVSILLAVGAGLTGCGLDDEPEVIPGSTACWLPEGYSAPEMALVGTADADADAFFADDALPLFELSFPDDSWAQICENAKDYADYLWELGESMDPTRLRHEYTPAVLEFQGVTYDPIGVRFRGRTTIYALFYDGETAIPGALQQCLDHQLARKPSLKISMDEFGLDEEIADQQTFNLVAREGSDSAYLREVLAHKLANQFGVVAPRAGHGRVCFNGVYEGLFSLVEEADTGRFVRQHFTETDPGGLWKVETDGDQNWSHYWDENGE